MTATKVLDWESHLTVRASDGDEIAIELLVDLYRPLLTNVARKILRNQDDVSDAVQETVLKACRAIRDFDPERKIQPWLCKICTNCCVDILRSKSRELHRFEYCENNVADRQNVEEDVNELLSHNVLLDAISKLPEQYRSIIVMRHFREMEVSDIATALDRPEGTIKSWLFRARGLLRKELTLKGAH